MHTAATNAILVPIRRRASWERPARAALGVASLCWLGAAARVVASGHTLFGTASYGATWGITVASIVHVIGISHVGIAVSAAVRVLRLERYRGIARLAEVMTLAALVVAVLQIAVDVGRPERLLVATLIHGRWNAPMVWSATVISVYFVASGTYLYLSLRRDLWLLSRTEDRRARLYRRLALGYRDTEAERGRHARTLRRLAVALVPVMVSVHSVYGLFFGLMSTRAGWYNPLQAPYFVLGAVVSGFSALVVLAALLRRLYPWRDLLEERLFRVLGALLAFVVCLYLVFVLSEHLTAQYAFAAAERRVSSMLLAGPYSVPFRVAVLGGLVAPFLLLFGQAMKARPVSVPLLAGGAAVVNAAMLLKRVLLVVPPQEAARLPVPMPEVLYRPTPLEMLATFGTYAVGGLLILAALGTIPMIELPLEEPERSLGRVKRAPRARRAVVAAAVAGGLVLIAWGVLARAHDLAPLKWISGLCLLAAVPLEVCLLGSEPVPQAGSGDAGTLDGGDV